MHLDGSPEQTDEGEPIATYDNTNIMDFARVWTGFTRQSFRGNLEARNGDSSSNNVDPMQISRTKRDLFPKMNLYDGYLGDGLPLCQDLPDRAYLRKGARYNFLGSSFQPRDHLHNTWFDDRGPQTYELDSRFSMLWKTLCAADEQVDYDTTATGGCTFPSEVVLDRNLGCHKEECDIDALRVVYVNYGSVADGTNGTVYYE